MCEVEPVNGEKALKGW